MHTKGAQVSNFHKHGSIYSSTTVFTMNMALVADMVLNLQHSLTHSVMVYNCEEVITCYIFIISSFYFFLKGKKIKKEVIGVGFSSLLFTLYRLEWLIAPSLLHLADCYQYVV